MPYRNPILTNDEYYHIFNRSLNNYPILSKRSQARIFFQAMEYYLNPKPPIKFSIYRKSRNSYEINYKVSLVKIIAYCLMPTHFHILLQQVKSDGIKKYMQRLTNSFSHYFNTRNERKGFLFEGPFKAVRVESDEQLLHLSRYIHLNPVTEYLVENPEDWIYSSYNVYLKKEKLPFIDPASVLSFFKSPEDYKEFVEARKNYQRELGKIKNLLFD